MQKHSVVVTSIGGISVGNSIASALQISKNYNLIATDINQYSSGLYENKGYVVPPAKAPDYFQKLKEICENEKIEAIYPGHELELIEISKNRKQLPIPIINKDSLIQLYHKKYDQYNFLKSKSIACPKTSFDAREIIDEFGFPIICKDNFITGGGSKSVHILKNETDLSFFKHEGQVFQEYINSPNEYTIGVLTSKEGKIIDSIPLKKVIVGPTKKTSVSYNSRNYYISTGISQGIFEDNEEVKALAEEIASKVDSIGPLNIQCRYIDGNLVVFELNPRFSATTSMRAEVGFNGPDVLFRNFVLGESFERLNWKKGMLALRTLKNVIVPL